MKLRLDALAYEIRNAKNDIVGMAQRLTNGHWLFRDMRQGWFEESMKEDLEEKDLLAEYMAIKKKRNAPQKEIKGASAPQDQPPEHRPM